MRTNNCEGLKFLLSPDGVGGIVSQRDNEEESLNTSRFTHAKSKITSKYSESIKSIDNLNPDAIASSIKRAPNAVKRALNSMSGTDILTKVPVITVILSLLVTGFFTMHSGINDCRDGYEYDWCYEESSMNVNGDLAVYLPEGSNVKELIEVVENDWTTNVMVIYVESEDYNVTTVKILDQIDAIENKLNPARNDAGAEDDIIYVLSISTVIKEVNSSAVRVAKAFFSGLAEASGNEELSDQMNETIDEQQDFLGNYAIPDEQERIDQILGEMPQNALNKLVRDVGREEAVQAFYWNRAVIILGIAYNENISVSDLIEETQKEINLLGVENNWDELNLTMTLTGPVPITNAVTEESFKLFWSVFPIGVFFVACGLFIFHCDLLQTGRIRWVQGVKVLIIAGLPTLCSVFVTMGIIGFTNYEVTMTVILVGPIVLALGVSYGLHITNRYAESKGTPQEKMAEALNSTGKAVFLSAVTTIIGFISLTFTPMKPIQTVGWGLAGGIVVVYIMTMVMVPNLTIMLDLKKPSHPPPKLFTNAVAVPVKWTRLTLSIFIIAMLISSGISRHNVEENIDLLDMAPQTRMDGTPVPAVQKMGQYSDEFEAGQPGFLLIHGDISASPELSATGNDPFSNLEGIEKLEANCNLVSNTTAVSVVFLMKAVAVSVNLSGTPISDIIDDTPLPEPIKDVATLIFDREQSGNASFWAVLDTLSVQETGGTQAQNFMIYVFYNSLTKEMRELFVSSDYQRSLIYIDMPFMDVQRTQIAVKQVNDFASQDTGGAITSTELIGVASVTIEVNNLIVGSQWSSLIFALLFTVLTLGLVFRDIRYALLTTIPVGFTVGMQWLVMDSGGVALNLVTVMIGSILVGVGVDFSIHIANRVKELGGSLEAIKISCASTGMSLFESTTVTALGLMSAKWIPIPAVQPFVDVVIILLIIAAISALLLLPAIYSLLVKANIGLTGGVSTMVKTAGLRRAIAKDEADVLDASLVFGSSDDAW